MRSHDTCDAKIPLRLRRERSVERKGGKGGCKIIPEKHNPLFPPLLRGTNFEHESGKHT